LNKIDEKVVPPHPPPQLFQNQECENGAFWLLRGFILDFFWGGRGWGFAVSFYSVQDCRLDRLYQVKLEAEAFANESAWTARANQENTLQQSEVVLFYLYDNRSR